MKTSDIKQRQQLKNQATGEIVQVSVRDRRQTLMLLDPISKKPKHSFCVGFLDRFDELKGWEVA
ncbi:hypothetical protein [Moraxella lincolnii]|uniref:Uncharacterized protein n=1 Tax=Lwoffella lincolnii TaxID=90241 RepID=A0A1T0CK60_9GAMM|nr:hypothetical protein [Moraxella lincolnii]OOS22748.1 hypothetical protein B0682_00550 [Moraxella lincolnii]